MSDKCQYPSCRCPFDMGPDNLCLIGKPNTDTTAVPKGWKLVPTEPTAEMRDAAQSRFEQGMMVTYQQMYRAMINASPTPTQWLGVDYSQSFILRRQAEAVKEAADDMLDDFPDYDLAHACLLVRVQSLQAEAAELESHEPPVMPACPECGSVMNEATPADRNCDIWWCGECGFNEPEDDVNE